MTNPTPGEELLNEGRYWIDLDPLDNQIYDILTGNESFEVEESDEEYRLIQLDELSAIIDIKEWHQAELATAKREAVEEFSKKVKEKLGLKTNLEYVMPIRASDIDDLLTQSEDK